MSAETNPTTLNNSEEPSSSEPAQPTPMMIALAKKADMKFLLSLEHSRCKFGDYIRSRTVNVGPYNVYLNKRFGVEVAEKNHRVGLRLLTKHPVEEILNDFETLIERFPGYLNILAININFLEQVQRREVCAECKRLELSALDVPTADDQLRIYEFIGSIQITEGISFDLPGWKPDLEKFRHLDHVEFKEAGWITEEDFLEFDAKHLTIGKNNLSESSITSFLRNWMTGKTPNLEVLQLENSNWTLLTVLHGLPVCGFDPKRRGKMYWPEGQDQPIDMSRAFDIQRNDGLIASVTLTETTLTMVVWKKEKCAEEQTDRKRTCEEEPEPERE